MCIFNGRSLTTHFSVGPAEGTDSPFCTHTGFAPLPGPLRRKWGKRDEMSPSKLKFRPVGEDEYGKDVNVLFPRGSAPAMWTDAGVWALSFSLPVNKDGRSKEASSAPLHFGGLGRGLPVWP